MLAKYRYRLNFAVAMAMRSVGQVYRLNVAVAMAARSFGQVYHLNFAVMIIH